MQNGKFNVILDSLHGSSGKGKTSSYLVEKYNIKHVSSANAPNAGHSIVFGDKKFVAKAIPTACGLHGFQGRDVIGFISPGSGFSWGQLLKEWKECNFPFLVIHDRAVIVTADHKSREEFGSQSTRHIASTMQGSATAFSDKMLRLPGVLLAGSLPFFGKDSWESRDDGFRNFFQENPNRRSNFEETVKVETGLDFRRYVQGVLSTGNPWFHEGSQGYALSLDHGNQYPNCTSRNCDSQMALSYMGVAPQLIGDVYLNIRSFPIRVGNVVEESGERVGYSGDWYSDQTETTWEEIAKNAGMPEDVAKSLSERERTTVTRRVRRVATQSWIGLEDSARTCGATKLCLNFPQYLDWKDNGLRGGKEAFQKLSKKTREYIDKCEAVTQLPVVYIGTGADHRDFIDIET